MGKPQTHDEYIDRFTEPGKQVLSQLRALANDAAPDTSETIKWGQPAWLHTSGTILFMISGHTHHANFAFTPSTREAFDTDLTPFATGKGSVQLPYTHPIPADLLHRMITFRIREHEEDGVLWL